MGHLTAIPPADQVADCDGLPWPGRAL